MQTISGLPAFAAYFAAGLALTGLYVVVYLAATAHREIALIRDGNTAAALAFGGSLLGYALPLSVAIRNAQSILDCLIWGLVALIVQVLIYWLTRFLIRDLSQRIAAGQTAAAVLLGSASLAGGVVNAASMSY